MPVLVAACALSALAVMAGIAATRTSDFTGTCLASPSLSCSAAAGQTYNGVTLDEGTSGGYDSERAVEAVLAHVLGPPVDAAPLATKLTADSGDFSFTRSPVAGGQSFSWSYRGAAQNLAYLTVEAGDGFAVFGIAGRTSGTVNLAGLTGGQDISHVSFWTTRISKAAPVPAERLHGDGFLGNSRLGKIENGEVPCLHVETAARAQCAFSTRGTSSGSWLESPHGDYALVGQSISLQGQAGGRYVVAAQLNSDGTVPALEPSGRDSAGIVYGEELGRSCVLETLNTATDAMDATTPGYRLINYATREVPTISYPHPDGATRVRSTPDGVHYYTGEGAALNDNNGTERNREGVYYTTRDRCHRVISNGADVPGSKRPATDAYNRVNPKSSIRWRPVNPRATIAN